MGNHQQQHQKTTASSVSKFVFFVVGLSVGITSCFYILSFYYVTNQTQLLAIACTTSTSSQHKTQALASTPLPPSSPPPPPPSPPPPPPPSPPPLREEEEEFGEKLLHYIEDDAELLWRGSLVPQIPEYPFRRVPRLAFMFLTRGPLPLAPLWEMFFKGNEAKFSIYIHTHPNYTDPMPKDSVFHGRRISSKSVEWANISMVDAERRLLASALLDYSNEKFILLSEACIPLYNFTTIYDYLLIKNTNLSFVGVEPDFKKSSPYRWRGKMDPPLKRWQWQKGAQWVVVDRVLSIDILSDTKYYPVFRDHCSWPCQNQDEHYVQILVMLNHPERNSNWSLTWTEWKGNRHPTMFGARSNISANMIQEMRFRDNCTIGGQITNMCYLFARKFAPNSIKQLLEISSTLFG